jgi:hypothetical protein
LEHEHHDEQRKNPLVARIEKHGVLRNPPIVTTLLDGSSHYMILDGANRVAALRELEFIHIAVQVVAPDDPGLKLYNWNHVIWDFKPQDMLAGLRQLQDINIIHGDPAGSLENETQTLAQFETSEGDLFTIYTEAQPLEKRVAMLNSVVDIYKQQAKLDRTSEWSLVRLKPGYDNLCGLLTFPKFEIKQVLTLAGRGSLLPTGITRFTVAPRALHLNYPLEAMAGNGSLQNKNEQLKTFIRNRLDEKGIRYYAEATFLFDE